MSKKKGTVDYRQWSVEKELGRKSCNSKNVNEHSQQLHKTLEHEPEERFSDELAKGNAWNYFETETNTTSNKAERQQRVGL